MCWGLFYYGVTHRYCRDYAETGNISVAQAVLFKLGGKTILEIELQGDFIAHLLGMGKKNIVILRVT